MHARFAIGSAAVAALLLFVGCKSAAPSSGGRYIEHGSLWVESTADIQQRYCSNPKDFPVKEIVARNARYAFSMRFPYRGLAITGLYCFEQNRKGLWVLRGFFPINGAYFRGGVGAIEFKPDGDSVDIVCGGSVLFTVKSLQFTVHEKEHEP